MIRSSIRHDRPGGGRVKPEPERKDKGRQDVPISRCDVTVASWEVAMVLAARRCPVCHVCPGHRQRCFSRSSYRDCLDYGTGDRLACKSAALGRYGIDRSPVVWSKSWEDESERRDQPLLPRPKAQNTVEDGGLGALEIPSRALSLLIFLTHSLPVQRHRGVPLRAMRI
jgi:hypothetical protein